MIVLTNEYLKMKFFYSLKNKYVGIRRKYATVQTIFTLRVFGAWTKFE